MSEREKVLVRRGAPPVEKLKLRVDHAYLSAGDTPTSGDRAYTGCYLCGLPRKEHAS